MIVPFYRASARSPVVSLFLLLASVWLGGSDAEAASFQGHCPDTDADSDNETETVACAFHETAAWSIAALGGEFCVGTWEYGKVGRVYRVSRDLVGNEP